ncbi:MAG TPA: BTAD domain-containing putative transcriptional regulator [Ktedonobacteraceae bacterium]|nr:BTAD domain-containing putative transcriptional regulator [Ktedonobacteraceae bacterium]
MQEQTSLHPSSSPLFRVYLCGPFQVERWNGTTYELLSLKNWGGSHDPRRLLKRLLCSSRRQVRRGELLEDLWPEVDPDISRGYLNDAVYRLRGALSPAKGIKSLLITADDHSNLAVPGQAILWVDADAAITLLTQAEAMESDGGNPLSLVQEAAQLLEHGQYLEEEEGLWAHSKRATIERTKHGCLLWQVRLYHQRGSLRQAEILLNTLVEQDAMDEDALCLLMTNLHLQQRTSEALRLFEETSRLLHEGGLEVAASTKKQLENIRDESINTLQDHPRQQKLSLISTATTPVITGLTQHEMLEQFSSDFIQSSCIDETTSEALEHFALLTEICRHLSEGNELKSAEHTLWAYLPRVETIAKLSFQDQHTAANIASQGYLLAASLAGHRNDLQGRHHYSEQALLYGKLAEDRNLQIAALRQLSITFDYLERPDKVLQIYQQSFPYLNEVSPLLRACIYAGVSGAYAQLKQKQEALRFMSLAYEHFPATPASEPGFLHTICRYSTLVFFDGLNYLELNQPDEAEKVLARIDGLQPKIQIPERVRIELLNYQIEVFTALQCMEEACTYLEAAVKSSLAIGSERRLHESFVLFQHMQNVWRNESRVHQLGNLFM